ncbi:MAG: tetratricopeptide repeat protein, partial [Gammaproteobacteria bacterium]|nr:tetratricopeptide repeat protein [Gammaproteobacteria bacterium]
APVVDVDVDAKEFATPAKMQKQVRPLDASQKARMNLKAAVKALAHNDNQTAIIRLRESLQQDASLLRARETLVALYLNTGRSSEAADVLRAGLQRAPKTTSLAMLYARLLANQRQLSQALSVLERARPAMADNLSFYALLAAYYQRDGKHAQAVSIYRDAVKYQPTVASWWLGLGVSLDAMNSPQGNDYQEVLNAFQQAYRGGGLSAEVRTYVRSRIEVLAALVPDSPLSDIEKESLFASEED